MIPDGVAMKIGLFFYSICHISTFLQNDSSEIQICKRLEI